MQNDVAVARAQLGRWKAALEAPRRGRVENFARVKLRSLRQCSLNATMYDTLPHACVSSDRRDPELDAQISRAAVRSPSSPKRTLIMAADPGGPALGNLEPDRRVFGWLRTIRGCAPAPVCAP
jgi:hypothetical protein